MSERQKQTSFLRTLIGYEDSAPCRHLQERIAKAERDESCIRMAIGLVGVVAAIALCGLGYSAVLLPEFFDNSSHFLVRFFSAVVLGSTICLAVFLGVWLWYRGVSNRLHDECRRFIKANLDSRLGTPASMVLRQERLEVYKISTPEPDHHTQIFTLSKAS